MREISRSQAQSDQEKDSTVSIQERFARPQEVSGLDIAFPVHVDHLIPSRAELSSEISQIPRVFFEIANDLFYRGSSKIPGIVLASGLDSDLVSRHIQSVLGSFEPTFEDKIDGVAYLLHRWFRDNRET